jgi:thioesterase domain-containing protein/acyl carrier protein
VNSSGKIDRRALGSMEIVSERRRVDARDDLESTIAQIWAEVLHVSNVGVTDNFFELGGNSLTAVNLIARITARTGCDLPVTTLFQASTVEQLARRIRDSRNLSSSPGPVVRLQPLGSKPPLIMIPPAGGGLICYSDLARMLAPDQPVLGVETVRGAESTGSVEALAGRYVRELRSASLNGPLRLAGWSFGGNVAFEMARQLAEQGRAVDLVLLLDSHARHKGKEPRDDEILLEIARVRELAGIAPETMAKGVRTIVKQFRANMRAARRYVPGHYGGRVALLRASDARWPGDYGWSRYCTRLEVHDIPGEHRTLLAQPHVTRLAAILRERFPWIEHS